MESNDFRWEQDVTPDQIKNTDSDRLNKEAQYVERFLQDTKQRKLLVVWMIVVISAWLFFTLFIVMFNSPLHFNVSDSVLTVLLATTTANVLGLPIIILKDLFGRGYNKKKK